MNNGLTQGEFGSFNNGTNSSFSNNTNFNNNNFNNTNFNNVNSSNNVVYSEKKDEVKKNGFISTIILVIVLVALFFLVPKCFNKKLVCSSENPLNPGVTTITSVNYWFGKPYSVKVTMDFDTTNSSSKSNKVLLKEAKEFKEKSLEDIKEGKSSLVVDYKVTDSKISIFAKGSAGSNTMNYDKQKKFYEDEMKMVCR